MDEIEVNNASKSDDNKGEVERWGGSIGEVKVNMSNDSNMRPEGLGIIKLRLVLFPSDERWWCLRFRVPPMVLTW